MNHDVTISERPGATAPSGGTEAVTACSRESAPTIHVRRRASRDIGPEAEEFGTYRSPSAVSRAGVCAIELTMTGRLQRQRVTGRRPVPDVRHRPEIPRAAATARTAAQSPIPACAFRRREAPQVPGCGRHPYGVGDGLGVDVGIARVGGVGHGRAPGLPSQLDGCQREGRCKHAAHRARPREPRRASRTRCRRARTPQRRTAARSTASCRE